MRGGCRYASRRKRLYVSNCRAARRSNQRAAKTYLLLFDYLFGKVAQSKEDVGASSFFIIANFFNKWYTIFMIYIHILLIAIYHNK